MGKSEISGQTGCKKGESREKGKEVRECYPKKRKAPKRCLRGIFDALFTGDKRYDEIKQTYKLAMGSFIPLITAGINDGSIKADIDPETVAAALINMISALLSRFALLGSITSEVYEKPVSSLLHEICSIFLNGIKA